jgi:integrase
MPSKGCWVFRAVVGFRPDGRLRYVEGRARSQAEAVRKKRAVERTGRQADAARVTVGEFLRRWLEEAKANLRVSTWASYERVLRLHVVPHVGGIPLAQFATADVNRLYAKLAKAGVTPGNTRKTAEVLASAMEAAVREGSIVVAPTRGAAKPRVTRPVVDVFTDDEVRAILIAAAGHRLEALFVVGIATGARAGELFGLETDDVNPEAGTLHIRRSLDETGGEFRLQPPKSKRGVRTIALPAFACDALARHLNGRAAGPVFTDSDGGALRKSNFVRRDWRAVLRAAGVPYRKFHTLRHTHASRLLAAGVDPAEVAKRLGDSLSVLLTTYSHWMPTGQDTAARIDAIYGDSGDPVRMPTGSGSILTLQGGDKVAGRRAG